MCSGFVTCARSSLISCVASAAHSCRVSWVVVPWVVADAAVVAAAAAAAAAATARQRRSQQHDVCDGRHTQARS